MPKTEEEKFSIYIWCFLLPKNWKDERKDRDTRVQDSQASGSYL